MGGLTIQHNMAAINAHKYVGINYNQLRKSTLKLSSGFSINGAVDNAAGLAISEKMRSQIRGLSQSIRNANDAISLLQTAEGGLNEDHSMLQRMRELAVQSANGTYSDHDRSVIQRELDSLKTEIDRISEATEFNTKILLNGSLGGEGSYFNYGSHYGAVDTELAFGGGKITTTSSIAGMKLNFTTGASGAGGENALWSADGKELTINLVANKAYTDEMINRLIKNATVSKGATNTPGNITFKSEYGIIFGAEASTSDTAAGVRQVIGTVGTSGNLEALVGSGSGGANSCSDNIVFTANSYGAQANYDNLLASINIVTDAGKGKESVTVDDDGNGTIHLSTGVKYSENDIAKLLKKAGYDYSVSLTDVNAPDGSNDGYVYFNVADSNGASIEEAVEGAGVGNNGAGSAGDGLTFQIGANGSEDQRATVYIEDMGSAALGITDIDVSTAESANSAIDIIDAAIAKVSLQRADLGALSNRMEHTINSLATANENLNDAESRIRDTEMAKEMMNYTKYNILLQASEAMQAQAMQQPQGILQLLT